MGRAAIQAIEDAADLELVASLGSRDSLEKLAETKPDVVVELTVPNSTEANVRFAVERGMNVVVGTTGWDDDKREKLAALLAEHPEVGVLIAPNFALGSVLSTKLAQIAAPFFESVEIIELHHPNKVDAPSGTALRTAELIALARHGKSNPDATESALDGARGANVSGIPVHSVRVSGLTAHQEVILGSPGETLTLRHDSMGLDSFMPGILLGVRKVADHPGLTFGLDHYLGLNF